MLSLARDWTPDRQPRDASGRWSAAQAFAEAANTHMDRAESDARRSGRRLAMRARQEYGFIRNRKANGDDPDADGRTSDATEAIGRAVSDALPGPMLEHFGGEPADAIAAHLVEHGHEQSVPDDVWESGVHEARTGAAHDAYTAGLEAVPQKYHPFLSKYQTRAVSHAQENGRVDPKRVFAVTDEHGLDFGRSEVVYDHAKGLWLGRDEPAICFARDDSEDGGYWRTLSNDERVHFTGTPGHGTPDKGNPHVLAHMRGEKKPHNEAEHPRTHGGRFDKKPTHVYDAKANKWVSATEGPGEVKADAPHGEVKPEAAPPAVAPEKPKVHSAKEHEQKVMGEQAKAAKPATSQEVPFAVRSKLRDALSVAGGHTEGDKEKAKATIAEFQKAAAAKGIDADSVIEPMRKAFDPGAPTAPESERPVPALPKMFHGSSERREELQPGSMLTTDSTWSAGYTTRAAANGEEDFTGKVHEVSLRPKNPHAISGTLHDAEGYVIKEGTNVLGRSPKSLREAAEAIHRHHGYDAVVAHDKSGQSIGALTLTGVKPDAYHDPVDILHNSTSHVPSNMERALKRHEAKSASAPATNKLGEPISPFVASLKQMSDDADAKRAAAAFQSPQDFHAAESQRHQLLAQDAYRKGDTAAEGQAALSAAQHAKFAGLQSPGIDREGPRAEPTDESAAVNPIQPHGLAPGETPRDAAKRITGDLLKQNPGMSYREAWTAANKHVAGAMQGGKPAPVPAGVGHGGLPDTKLTLWQNSTTGDKRAYLDHPSLQFGNVRGYIAKGEDGKLQVQEHGQRYPTEELRRVAAPLLAKHADMASLEKHATPGKSAKHYAEGTAPFLPQAGETKEAAQARITAQVQREHPRLSKGAADKVAARRMFQAQRRATSEEIKRQVDSGELPFSRGLAGIQIAAGDVIAFSISASLGDSAETPSMGHDRPNNVNGIATHYFWKPVLSPGVIHHPNPKIGDRYISPADVAAVHKNTKDWMRTEGGRPFIPTKHPTKEHPLNARDNMGRVIETKVDDKGTLHALMQLVGDDARLTASRNEVSVGLRYNFKSGKSGRVFPLLLEHVALVPDPVIEGLGSFVPLSRSA